MLATCFELERFSIDALCFKGTKSGSQMDQTRLKKGKNVFEKASGFLGKYSKSKFLNFRWNSNAKFVDICIPEKTHWKITSEENIIHGIQRVTSTASWRLYHRLRPQIIQLLLRSTVEKVKLAFLNRIFKFPLSAHYKLAISGTIRKISQILSTKYIRIIHVNFSCDNKQFCCYQEQV